MSSDSNMPFTRGTTQAGLSGQSFSILDFFLFFMLCCLHCNFCNLWFADMYDGKDKYIYHTTLQGKI